MFHINIPCTRTLTHTHTHIHAHTHIHTHTNTHKYYTSQMNDLFDEEEMTDISSGTVDDRIISFLSNEKPSLMRSLTAKRESMVLFVTANTTQ